MKEHLDPIEDEIKALEDIQLRLAFCVEQTTHAYTNIYVEKYREWGIPYEQELGRVSALVSMLTPVPLFYFIYLLRKYKKDLE